MTLTEIRAQHEARRVDARERLKGWPGKIRRSIARIDEQERAAIAIAKATSIVWRHQHVGAHEQDRFDAMQWLEDNADGRCKCAKCSALWKRGDPSRRPDP